MTCLCACACPDLFSLVWQPGYYYLFNGGFSNNCPYAPCTNAHNGQNYTGYALNKGECPTEDCPVKRAPPGFKFVRAGSCELTRCTTGTPDCESCGAGFKLENLRSACTGPFRVDRDDRWYQIMLAKRLSQTCVCRRWVCRSAPQPGLCYTYGVGYGQRLQQRAVSTRSGRC